MFKIHKDVGEGLNAHYGVILCTGDDVTPTDSTAHNWVEVTCGACLLHKPSWEKAKDKMRIHTQNMYDGKKNTRLGASELWNEAVKAINEMCAEHDTSFKAVLGLIGAIIGGLIAFGFVWMLVMALFWAVIVMVCWNGVAVSVFGLGAMSYWQAYGLTLLCRILLRSGSSPNLNWNNKD
jgi:hypothetical protein